MRFGHSKTHLWGSSCRLYQEQLHYDLRKYFFSNRVLHLWNGLPDDVVTEETTKSFKNGLDKLWKNQEVKYY
jgi:hypothetical protein